MINLDSFSLFSLLLSTLVLGKMVEPIDQTLFFFSFFSCAVIQHISPARA